MADRTDLPRPVTNDEIYLHDMATSLRVLLKRLQPAEPATTGRTVVQEPKDGAPKGKRGTVS